MESYELIDQLRELEPVDMVCKAFSVPRASYYDYCQQKRHINVQRLELKAHVIRTFNESRGSAGSRMIQSSLANEGIRAGRYSVRSLMKEASLVCCQPGPHKYKIAKSEHTEVPNILSRAFNVSQPNHFWCGDITYIWSGSRWIYLAVVMDLYARRVVGWALSDKVDTQLAMKALSDAFERRGRQSGLMFHSDQGSQYSSTAYRQLLWRCQITKSMSHRENCWDNAPLEKLFRSYKSEWMPRLGYRVNHEAKMDIGHYLMDYYNNRRPHSYNNGLSPAAAENKLNLLSGNT
jgi:putative transposase